MTDAFNNEEQQADSQNAEQNVTMSLGQAIEIGQQLHRSGRLQEAANVYQQILTSKPGQPEALHFLGLLLHQTGQQQESEKLILAALQSNPEYIDALSNLGNIYLVLERHNEANEMYQRALAVKPDFLDAHLNLATLYHRCGRFDQAIDQWKLAMKLAPGLLDPDDVDSSYQVENAFSGSAPSAEGRPFKLHIYAAMAKSLMRLGRNEQAVEYFRHWQELEPGNPRPRHHIAALTGMEVPPRAPEDYIKSVFDPFAETFDSQLEKLRYSVPARMNEAVKNELGEPAANLSILDAGCGTGLCAAGLRPYAKRLIGVDLSAGMLQKARQRELYDELIEAELTEFLFRSSESFDLIVTTDVFIYFGDLFEVMTAAANALCSGGRLVFSVENASEVEVPSGFHLQGNGRYRHTKSYFLQALQQAGLKWISLNEIFVRTEGNSDVMGFLCVGQRP